MTTRPFNPLRRALALWLAGGLIGALPVGFGVDPASGAFSFGPPAALAKDGDDEDDDDNSGHGGDDRDDDNSGSGGDRDDDADDAADDADDAADDRNDDTGGGDRGNDPVDDDRGRDAATPARTDSPNGGSDSDAGIPDILIRYADGWTEQISGGRYRLVDHLNRQVILRNATRDDYARMVALGS